MAPRLTRDDNSIEFCPFSWWGLPGLAEPSTIPVDTEAKCARGIREELKIMGRSPVRIQKESNPIPGLNEGLPPRNIFQCFIHDVDVVTEAINRVSSIQEPSQEHPTGMV